jgi:hypothetical protein
LVRRAHFGRIDEVKRIFSSAAREKPEIYTVDDMRHIKVGKHK